MAPTFTTAFPCPFPEPLICLPKIHFIIVSYIRIRIRMEGGGRTSVLAQNKIRINLSHQQLGTLNTLHSLSDWYLKIKIRIQQISFD